MTTRNIVPRETGEGSLGTSTKKWGTGYIETLHGTADKAVADKNGLQIDTSYLNTKKGDIPSRDFNQATTEGFYGFGNYENNRPFDYGRLLTLSHIGWLWQIAFPTRNGKISLRTNTNNEGWLEWRTIPFNDNPVFTGEPQAPTQITNDNSKKLATTAFVKAQSATMATNLLTREAVTQYWTKEPSGTITQYVEINLNGDVEIDVQFPISFPQKCLFLDVEIINVEKDTSLNCSFHTIEKTVDGAKLLKVGNGSPKKIVVKAVGI